MAIADFPQPQGVFQYACLILAVALLLWDTVEVGRNDAANLVNAVLGARVLSRRGALFIAGAAVIVGAVLSSAVIDTARKGIFDPTELGTIRAALTVYVSVYIVDTVLLYGYSAFGMPVSTTACLVFELLGAAMAVNVAAVRWDVSALVVTGIICSIALSGFASFLIQRAVRGAIRERTSHLATLLLHGGWVGGGMAAGLSYFLLLKGMKNVPWVKQINDWLGDLNHGGYAGASGVYAIVFLWGGFAILIHFALVLYRKRAARLLFPVLAVLGMIAMSVAFGQNDLANCASPGLAVVTLLRAQSLEIGTKIPIAAWMLLVCGVFLAMGMTTQNAQRVTKATISAGSMGDHVALWAPRWCVILATKLLRRRTRARALAPRAGITAAGKTIHFDTLRACVIMSVSASVIAMASSLGLPVSTTYVAFAAVIATGMADRIFQRGDADLKLARAFWVVASWVISAALAAVAGFLVASTVLRLGLIGIAACLAGNLLVRTVLKKRADRQAQRVEEEAYERIHPEAFALEEEDA